MKFIFSYLRSYRTRLSFMMIAKALGTVTDLILPYLMVIMIDDILPTSTSDDFAWIIYLGLIMLGVSILGLLLNFRANRQAELIAANAVKDMRNDLFQKVEELSAKQVDDITTSSLVSRMTTDTYNIFSFFGMIQRLGVRGPLLLVGGIAMAFFLDPILALLMIAMLPFIVYVTLRYTIKGQPLYHDIQVQVDSLIRIVRENITGVRVVRALSMTDFEIGRFDKENKATVQNEIKATIFMSKIRPLIDSIMNIGMVVVLIVGAYRVFNMHTTTAQIFALVSYFTIILNAMMSVTRMFIQTSRASASSARIKEVIDLEDMMVSGTNTIVENDALPHLSFENVTFSYHNRENHLTDISFDLYKGQTLGIIGATGSGKTTIINLLLRFYDPQAGDIKIFGSDLKSLKTDDIRSHMGLVLQNDLIFSDTIYENIQFSRDNICQSDVETAAEIAQAHFIADIADGYQHQLSQRGTNISGGQKQRLLIARAIAGRPDILILDDASSALDYQTDMRLRRAINENLADTTKIIIAQRISSIMDSDLILVIEDGKIIARGKHEKLMKESNKYQILAEHQLGGSF